MWFKNLIIYQLEQPFAYDAESLEARLAPAGFRPCTPHQLSSLGWTSPLGRDDESRVHGGSGALLICAKKEERILPASVIKDFMAERIEAIETAEMRKVRKNERDRIRDEVVLDLTPKAFTRSNVTYALILPEQRLLLVDASSLKKADEFTELLRKTLGDTPLSIPRTIHAISDRLTQWLTDPSLLPSDFKIGDECELQQPTEEGGIVRCRRHDLESEEIKKHLDAGKRGVKLALHWDEKLSFVLLEDLSLKKLKYADELIEQAADLGADDAAARFDAEFTLMALELARFVPRLAEVLGGFEVDD
ncbi:MAG: recombination-associated protein RdgC [Thiotrichales bacterium]